MEAAELDILLDQLRRMKTDHQDVEAKRATNALPDSLWSTISAFANASGGMLILGVDENDAFRVTGLAEPNHTTSELQALAAQMEPAVRLTIALVDHPDGVVLVAQVPAAPPDRRPCHLRSEGPYTGSFIRVGDGDYQLSRAEVDALHAAQVREDLSGRPAPTGAQLNAALAGEFCGNVRAAVDRYRSLADVEILRAGGAVGAGDIPTLAGILALGETPQAHTPAARLAYRLLPGAEAPAGARFSGTHIEGTVGEILDDVLARLKRDLTLYQIQTNQGLIDDTDVPLEILREIIANALVHRSFAPALESVSVQVEVSEAAVRVVSPGALHITVDPERLGLAPFAGVRNLALVGICERANTPSGRRIIEAQGSGIPACDRIAYQRGLPPPLFINHPDRFEVILLRGRIAIEAATEALQSAGRAAEPAIARLMAWSAYSEGKIQEMDLRVQRAARLDMFFGARLCSPSAVEDAAAYLKGLEDRGLLIRVGGSTSRRWIASDRTTSTATEEAEPVSQKRDRIRDLLTAVAEHGGTASREQIAVEMGLSALGSSMKWVNRAMERGLVKPTTESPFDPGRAYALTAAGWAVLGRTTEGRERAE